MSRALSKSKYLSGRQCHRKLWWEIHEPDAPELVPSASLQAVFNRGHLVGGLACERFPGGVFIDRDALTRDQAVAATRDAMAAGAPSIFEGSFLSDGLFAAADIVERDARGWRLVEVKSTLDVKDVQIEDVAFQLHVLRTSGHDITSVEVMHLNRACRHPDLSNLFERTDVTEDAEGRALEVPEEAARQIVMLAGPLPVVEIGKHCRTPHPCPFLARCWPTLPEHHVSELWSMSASLRRRLDERGCESIREIPDDVALNDVHGRQRLAVQRDGLVLEPGLRVILEAMQHPIAHLDFETINPPVPAWPGCAPFEQVPVQFSVHVEHADGRVEHHEFVADDSSDPRPSLVAALLAATRGAVTVLAYNASFERTCLRRLASAIPSCADELIALASRIDDLLPIVRNHVGHPQFRGTFGLKSVLPVLVPGMGYDDLEVADGSTASALLEAMLLGPTMDVVARDRLREALLLYCGRDTEGLVAMVAVLRTLA